MIRIAFCEHFRHFPIADGDTDVSRMHSMLCKGIELLLFYQIPENRRNN